MKNKTKKYIAPIVVTVLLLLYYVILVAVIASLATLFWKIFAIVVTLAISVTMVCVCVDRIRDIKGGEEDDISQY